MKAHDWFIRIIYFINSQLMQTICIWNRNSLGCKRPNIPQGGWWCFSAKVAAARRRPRNTSVHMNLTWLPFSVWQKWVCSARGSWGFCTLTPASIQIKQWQKAVGVGSRAPLIKQWSWLLQEAAISHWSLGTVWKSHKGLCLSMSITVCTQSYSRVESANLRSFLIPPWL